MSSDPEPSPRPRMSETPGDLGFGSVVANISRRRLLNRDGSFNVRRFGLGLRESLSIYHEMLTMSWSRLIGLIALAYLFANLFFASLFYLCGPDALQGASRDTHLPRFMEAFFFSVHTLATIGYGNLSPRSLSANLIVTVESLVGLLGVALVAGIMFAKFARPTAQFLFSEKALIAPYQDVTAFMFRIANQKKNQLVELQAKLMFSRWKKGEEGVNREFVPLKLERNGVIFFPLTWTIVHPIDRESPLWGATAEELRRSDAEFLILLSGVDETFAQLVHARSSYKSDELVWGAKFRSLFNQVAQDGIVSVNLRDIHAYEEVGGR